MQGQVLENLENTLPHNDKQVGLGMLGLANLLRRYKVTYVWKVQKLTLPYHKMLLR